MARNTSIHLSGYQARDLEVIDYQMTELDDSGLMFRGPFPDLPDLSDGNYFTAIGAAQTMGCFCETPFPTALEKEFNLPALNLGYGGAGPEFYLQQKVLLEKINQGKFLILQAMSGRSQSNSIFDSGGLEYLTKKSNGEKTGSLEGYRQLLLGNPSLRKLKAMNLGPAIARRLALPKLKKVVAETRQNWLKSNLSLIEQVTVPIIFLWFSKRAPDYPESYTTISKLFGEFPHMISADMVKQVAQKSDYYVECISDRGSPQPLFSRHTGEPVTVSPANDRPDLDDGAIWTHNIYYPSPEMHEDAVEGLLPVVKKILS